MLFITIILYKASKSKLKIHSINNDIVTYIGKSILEQDHESTENNPDEVNKKTVNDHNTALL